MWHKLKYDRRVQILLLLIAAVTTRFWMTSRYPSLDTKSMMAGSVSLADGLSFDAWIAHDMAYSLPKEIAVTFLNWVHTNEQGMIFGLTIATLFMCLLPLIRDDLDRFLTRRFSATVSGALMGAPLGVCVNCAAPIGYGLYRQGARLEAALATMISSPTMNIVVLSMAFTLFPPYIVIIKLVAVLATIFIVVPWVVSRFPGEAMSSEIDSPNSPAEGNLGQTPGIEKDAIRAVQWIAYAAVAQAWALLTRIVPLMLLAGFIGAVAVVLLPWDELVAYLPDGVSLRSVAAMVLLSAFGLVLPVPIAFDVILAASLINAGISIQYVAVLLFVLGSFSVYSLLVLLKARARKVAVSLSAMLIVVGVVTGFVTKGVADFYSERVEAPLFQELAGTTTGTAEKAMPTGLSGGVYQDDVTGREIRTATSIANQLAAETSIRHATASPKIDTSPVPSPPTLEWQKVANNPRVEFTTLSQDMPGQGKFTRLPIAKLGLHHHFKPLVYNFINEFPDANGIAGGDFDNDGWFDLLFATPNGLFVYKNVGGTFRLVSRLTGDHKIAAFDAGAAAFVDIDNDTYEDIIFSEHGSGLWLSSNNRDGEFKRPGRLPGSQGRFCKSLAFYDLDSDGQLEFFAGHVSSMLALRPSHEASQNLLYRRFADGRFQGSPIKEPFGETLSIWVSDLDNNNALDLWIGNDFDEPDMFYELENGRFAMAKPGKVEQSTRWTMSFDAADIDNDLDMEVYAGQTTWNPSSPPFKIEQGRGIIEKFCERFEGPYCTVSKALAQTRRAVKKLDAKLCEPLQQDARLDCVATVYFRELRASISPNSDKAETLRKAELLKPKYPKLYQNFLEMLEFDPITVDESNARFGGFVRQRNGINTLMVLDANGNFKNQSVTYGVEIGGWTWNARFADLDADEWQDLYVANGWTPSELETTNVYFRNDEGRRFINATRDFGLLDFEPTIAYTYIDFDNDGDLDIINYSQVGRVAVFRNDLHHNNNIQFELRDSKGNHHGVGSKLVIHYGDGQRSRQIREIKMVGGHLSFDPKIAHFGIGQNELVGAVSVQWSTGEREKLDGPFKAGARYRIRR